MPLNASGAIFDSFGLLLNFLHTYEQCKSQPYRHLHKVHSSASADEWIDSGQFSVVIHSEFAQHQTRQVVGANNGQVVIVRDNTANILK